MLVGIKIIPDQNLFIKETIKNKLLTVRASENVVRLLPPLNVKKENMTPTVSCFESCLDVPITNGKKSIGSFVFKSSNPSEKTSVLISHKNSIRKAVDNISGA